MGVGGNISAHLYLNDHIDTTTAQVVGNLCRLTKQEADVFGS